MKAKLIWSTFLTSIFLAVLTPTRAVAQCVIMGSSGSNIGEYESIRGGGDGYNDQSPLLLAGVKVAFFSASGSRRVMHIGRLGGEPALNAVWAFVFNTRPGDGGLEQTTSGEAGL